MTGHAQQVDVHFLYIDGHMAGRLNCVGVERDTLAAAECADLLNRLHGADFVICKHNGNKSGILSYSGLDILKADNAVFVDIQKRYLKALLFKLLEGVQNRMMLKLGGDKVLFSLKCTELCHGDDSLVIRLRTAGGKVYLLGLRADNVGNGLSGFLKSFLCLLRKRIQARGVAVQGGEVRHHCVKSGLAHARGCCVICVNKHIYIFLSVNPIKNMGILTLYDKIVNSFYFFHLSPVKRSVSVIVAR